MLIHRGEEQDQGDRLQELSRVLSIIQRHLPPITASARTGPSVVELCAIGLVLSHIRTLYV